MSAETGRRFSDALRAVGRMDQEAMMRARAEGERARAEASRPGPTVVSIPALGPYVPPGMGEQAAMAAGAGMLARLQALEADRWRVSMPLLGGVR